MMVYMQSNKSLKALKEWGIELYNVGEDGTKSMRSMEDIILDVSLLINNTAKDTIGLLTTLSGGKYQYSKVSAMLGNYKELLRMMKLINNPNDNLMEGKPGLFIDQQVEVQMDTLQRKINSIKADAQNIIFDIGVNAGGLDALKWLADKIDDIIVGTQKIGDKWGETGTKIAGVTVAALALYKAVEKIQVAMKTYEMYKAAYNATGNT